MNTITIQQVDLREPTHNKVGRWQRLFVLSAGGIFFITGFAKVISALGTARVLKVDDPIFGLSFQHLLLLAGILELIIPIFCFNRNFYDLARPMIACLSLNILSYRIGLWLIGWHRPCSCLGNLTDAIHLSPQSSDALMKFILCYLLAGSFGAYFFDLGKKLITHSDNS